MLFLHFSSQRMPKSKRNEKKVNCWNKQKLLLREKFTVSYK